MSLLEFFFTTGSSGQGQTANFRAATFNIYNFSTYGDAQYNAIVDHINRVDADIITLQEVSDAGYTVVTTNMLSDTGYTYSARGKTGNFGNCVMSKYPISNGQVIDSTYVNAPGGGDEMNSSVCPFRFDINFNGHTIVVYAVHYEPWCSTAPCLNEIRDTLEFPRAIQIHRTYQDYQAQKIAKPTAKFIFQGDFNDDDTSPQTVSFSSEPAGIRGDFVLGSDIGFPFTYATYPDQFLTDFTVLKGTDLAGDRNTIWANDPNPALTVPVRLDYISVDSNITHIGNEVLNSESDANTGLPKVGSPLTAGLSQTASDHKLVFADLHI